MVLGFSWVQPRASLRLALRLPENEQRERATFWFFQFRVSH
jgi:hypothetical protein